MLNMVTFISKLKTDSILINTFNTEYRKTTMHVLIQFTKESEKR